MLSKIDDYCLIQFSDQLYKLQVRNLEHYQLCLVKKVFLIKLARNNENNYANIPEINICIGSTEEPKMFS